ncbi:A/G-specific adenine glycosylase [Flammeovirgaceae bacterium 311]|nr:A/G-specific adenine glycosylase [Flammeovirgaceae bacterium 311]
MFYQDNHIENSHLVAAKLIGWYQQHHRDLPWRHSNNPYQIWLSEIILQQTRVQQGLPYYQRFIAAFPTVQELAAAPEQEVLRLWQGLGYYNRARNLHACARQVVEQHGGQFPQSYESLQKLPGIGKYTAAAIVSFAFKKAVPVVDGNVYRVLARLYGETTDIARPEAFKTFFKIAEQLIDHQQPDIFNQSIMEFGALHCTPLKPLCLYCPLQQQCWAFAHSQQEALPVKSKKAAVRFRYFHYLVLASADGKLLLRPRPAGDIWQGLFDFYLVEADGLQEEPEALEDPLIQEVMRLQPVYDVSPAYSHQLTHQRLHVRFFHFNLSTRQIKKLAIPPEFALFSASEVDQIPKPVLIQNYLKDVRF